MEHATNATKSNVDFKGHAIYGVYEKPPLRIAIPLGLQHVLSIQCLWQYYSCACYLRSFRFQY